jgi:hypothetical protein
MAGEVSPIPARGSVPLSFAIVRIGEQTIRVPELDEEFVVMVVVLRSSASGRFRMLHGDGDYATLEEAEAQAGSAGSIAWRPSTAPLAGEQACWLCACTMGRLLEARERHPERLCEVCALDATDEQGRPVRFGNRDMSGGFRSFYADNGEDYGRHECMVGGHACWADEARFGGIVITPRRGAKS